MQNERRSVLADAILRLLDDGKPRTAREIALQLRSNAKFEWIEHRDVNSILYNELATRLTKDERFRWANPRSGPDQTALVPSATRSPAPQSPVQDRRSLLRTIHRLRAGLPPFEQLSTLTVGGDLICSALSRFLRSDGARWMVISGNYGEGKSHSLGLLRELAQSQGYATCQLSADGALAALNHPQRFLPALMATLEAPGSAMRGYTELLIEALTDQHSRNQIRRMVAGQIVRHLTRPDAEEVVGRLRLLDYDISGAPSEGFTHAADQIALHLSGESIQHRSATEGTRIFAYSLLRIALQIVTSRGLKGIAILIDETESISTKLHGIRSRSGAYRVLSALCESPELVKCKVALAATPDALRQFATEIPLMMSELGRTPGEPIDQWARRLKEGPPTLTCQALKPGQRGELLNSVRRIYSEAYQGSLPITGNLVRAGTAPLSRNVPTRIVVRSAIDRLDAARWAGRVSH